MLVIWVIKVVKAFVIFSPLKLINCYEKRDVNAWGQRQHLRKHYIANKNVKWLRNGNKKNYGLDINSFCCLYSHCYIFIIFVFPQEYKHFPSYESQLEKSRNITDNCYPHLISGLCIDKLLMQLTTSIYGGYLLFIWRNNRYKQTR